MKNRVLILLILGLAESIFTADAQEECPEGKKVWDSLEFRFTNLNDSRNQDYTDMKVRLTSKVTVNQMLFYISSIIFCPLKF